MQSIVKDISASLFSFKDLMQDIMNTGWLKKPIPNILLSSIKTLAYDVVTEFESMSIYDLDDLISYQNVIDQKKIQNSINIQKIKELAVATSAKKYGVPMQLMDMPDNFATVAINAKKGELSAAINWKGIKFLIDSDVQTLQNLNSKIADLLRYCGEPELITDIRQWNTAEINDIDPIDLSVFLGNFDVFQSLQQYCEGLGSPNFKDFDDLSLAEKQLYYIEYLIWLSQQFES